MRKRARKFTALILAVIMLALCAVGCGEEKGAEKTSAGAKELDSYDTEIMQLPSGVQNILDIVELEDGKLRIVGGNEFKENIAMYDSADQGKSWEKVADLKSLKITKKDFAQAFLSPKGNALFSIRHNISDENAYNIPPEYMMVDASGEAKEFNIELPKIENGGGMMYANGGAVFSDGTDIDEDDTDEDEDTDTGQEADEAEDTAANGEDSEAEDDTMMGGEMQNEIGQCFMLSDGNIVVSDMMSQLHLFDGKTAELLLTYNLTEYSTFSGVCEYKDSLLLFDYSGQIILCDPKTGKIIKDEKLAKVSETLSSGTNVYMASTPSAHVLPDGKTVIFFVGNGMYQYTEENGVKQTAKVWLGSDDSYTQKTIVLDENIYYSLVQNYEQKGEYSSERTDLVKNTKSKEKHKIDTTLTIWTLQENYSLSAAISRYESAHKNVEITIETGLTYDETGNAATATDVIKKLNTKLLSGEGPDVIVLDNLPINSYIEKGVLADLTEMVNKAKQDYELFENVVDTYGKDGKISAIPTGFSLLGVAGNKNMVSNAKNLNSFFEQAQNQEKANKKVSVFGEDLWIENDSAFYYNASIPNIIKDDKIDKAALKTYFEQMKALNGFSKETQEREYYFDSAGSYLQGLYAYSLLEDQSQVTVGYITQPQYSLTELEFLKNQKKDMDYGLINTDAGTLYLPGTTLGANAKSGDLDAAKDFILSFLTDSNEKYSYSETMTVNKKNMRTFMNVMDEQEDYTMFVNNKEIKVEKLTEEQKDSFIKLADSANTPIITDATVMEAVTDSLAEYLSGKKDVNAAVDAVMKKVDLYMAE